MKRIVVACLSVVILLGLSGCSAVFSNTYYSEKDFQGSQGIDLDSNEVVQNYAELRRLVFGLLNDHEESLELVFSGYTGNVVSDIASVCNAVNTESAYGAYCVDYVSYDLTQIVSYYEAVITVAYRYTQEELAGMKTTNTLDGFAELIAEELVNEPEQVVVKVNNGTNDKTTVSDMLERIIRNNPLAISYYPKVNVEIYSGNSSQKIYEVNIVYDADTDNAARLTAMKSEIDRAAQSVKKGNAAQTIVAAAEYLEKRCNVVASGGNTAYDALVSGIADSEGVASAFKALCDKTGIECMVVSGRMDRLDHYWNIVKIDDAYYHVDVSVLKDLGGAKSLLLRDADKQIDCWWDQSAYPDCDGTLTYRMVVNG